MERPALSPRISISCPCLYGLIRSYLHVQGRCELCSASDECMSLPSGGRSERGPNVGIPFPPCLEGPARSITLGPSYDPVQLHTTICSSAQRGDRGGAFFGPKPQFLQPVLSCTEEGWGFASYSRSAQAELLPLQRKIQDADAQEHSFPGLRVGLVCHCWLEGCLLPHSGNSETQEVPQVRLRGKGLQGSSLWTSSGSKDVQQELIRWGSRGSESSTTWMTGSF